MKAIDLIRRSYALINIPGQGGVITDPVLSQGFDALVELLDSESVSKLFVPGIRTHFFALQSGKSIYSYGANTQCDFRSDDFDDDPAPIMLEDAYILSGTSITNNEQVDEYRFENTGSWVTTGVGNVVNNSAYLDGIGTLSQDLSLTSGKTYTLRLDIDVNAQDVRMQVQQNSVDILDFTLDATGLYEYDFEYTGTLPKIIFTTSDSDDDVQIFSCSIIERGKERLELPDGQGAQHKVRVINQIHSNETTSINGGFTAGKLRYNRTYGKSDIKLSGFPTSGNILVMDVLVNRVTPNRITSTLRLQPEAIRAVRYKLADTLAAEHGKELTPSQFRTMNEAWDKMLAGNTRMNNLRVDKALTGRSRYNINQG